MKFRRIVALIAVSLILSSTTFAIDYTDERVEMEFHEVYWMFGGEHNQSEEEFQYYAGGETREKTRFYRGTKFAYIDFYIPKNFYLGEAGHISFNLYGDKSFIKIINHNLKEVKIENLTRLFSISGTGGENFIKDGVNHSVYIDSYKLKDKLVTSNETIQYEINNSESVEGHLLIVPQNVGKYSITLISGENQKVLDKIVVNFEVKEAKKGMKVGYEVKKEIGGRITRGLEDIQLSIKNNRSTRVTDGKPFGKVNGEMWCDFEVLGNKDNVDIENIGRVNLLDDNGYAIVDEEGNLIKNKINIKDGLEESEIVVTTVYPNEFERFNISYSGGLRIDIKLINEVNQKGFNKLVLLPLAATPIFLFFYINRRLKVSISEITDDEGTKIILARKGGKQQEVTVKVIVEDENNKPFTFVVEARKNFEEELTELISKNYKKISIELEDRTLNNFSKNTVIEKLT